MRMMRLLLLPIFAFANTLPDVIEKLQQNDLLQSMHYVSQAQQKALNAVKMAYLPKLTANAMYSYIPEDQRGLFDPQTNYSFEASFVLFDGFRRYHSIKAQSGQTQASEEQELQERESLTLNAIKLYFSLLSLHANIDAKEQKRKQLEEEVTRLEEFFAAGSISEDKVEQIKAAYAMTQYELALLNQNYQDITFSLSALTGLTIDDPAPAHIVKPEFNLKGSTHDLLAAAHTVESLGHQAQNKTADYWPTLLVKDTYSATQYYPSNLAASGFSLPGSTNKVQLVAQITLFDFFSKAQEKGAILLQQKAKESELAYKQRDLAMKQKLAKIDIDTSMQKIAASMQSFKSSQKNFEFIKERFKVNLVDSVTYLDALSNFYQSKALLAASKHDLEVAYANYYYQFGISLKEKIQ